MGDRGSNPGWDIRQHECYGYSIVMMLPSFTWETGVRILDGAYDNMNAMPSLSLLMLHGSLAAAAPA
ncbi:hypothetical protein DNTS_024896 [Danionella cerebrum]|uniref:Uncharacterized protein n=1 Tax=Danionella cerebrum TaxID=2873325 RepID=A0A553QS94_9TELE|nr:hypothetical protein DNTS_024896 [Danionella translucida]